MHVLIILAHPDPHSLTTHVAREIAARLAPFHTTEIADLSAEGFSPTFTLEDAEAYRTAGPVPLDVQQEQSRLERATAVVFVHPIYWWGLPALLKGWVERVFTNGWAYGGAAESKVNALRGKQFHLVGLGASGLDIYERHGYLNALRTQIEHGIFEYCAAPVTSSRILFEAEGIENAQLLQFVDATASDIVAGLAQS